MHFASYLIVMIERIINFKILGILGLCVRRVLLVRIVGSINYRLFGAGWF